MTKFLTPLFLFVLMMLVSCGKDNSNIGSKADAVGLDEISTSQPVPNAALNFNVNLLMDNFDAKQEAKVMEAAELIKKVVGSEEFKNKILNHKFKGKKAFEDNGGLSNAQIYKRILEGSESLRPGTDNEMDLDLEAYHENNSTVGYTYPNTVRVWMNEKFLNARTPASVTTNMMHEWLHKLGFKHAQKKTPTRKYTVPYAVGYLVASIAKKLD